MADYSKLTKRELIMTLYARDLMLENERKRLEYLPEKYFELKQQLATTEKALELACEEIIGSCEYCSYNTMPECPIEADCLDEKINYFKTKAKEMLENESK